MNCFQKIMAGPVLLVAVQISSLFSITKSWDETIKNQSYTFEMLDKNDNVAADKNVFVAAFKKAYETISLEQLQITNLDEFLSNSFDGDQKLLEQEKNGFTFIHVKDKENTVACLTVEQDSETDATGNQIQKPSGYISILAVEPTYARKGIGEKLVQTSFSLIPNLQKMKVNPRKINKTAIKFYKKLGFKKSSHREVHEGLNKNLYKDLEYIAPNNVPAGS
jgi:ribosomal protein S18 acetylase RimI-like enzyme